MPRPLRAMISSTARDLAQYRRSVMDACLSVDVFPALMENLPASASDAIEASMRMVDGADIYIGLFANRYGYIPPEHHISITEMEYWRAVERGIPILIYVLEEGTLSDDLRALPTEADHNQQQLRKLKEMLTTKHVVNFFRSPDDLRASVIKGLWHAVMERSDKAPEPQKAESPIIAAPLSEHYVSLNQKIKALTEEQYQILDMLRYHRRISVAGCAGSGKTLVAVQKASLLDKAGSRTLILCHNRNLANYIRKLLSGTGVSVRDFTSWVNALNEKPNLLSDQWTQYEEPTGEELSNAFDRLVDSDTRYDAIIVDEGQDFRDEWWLLVEAALTNPEYGILYIFHDDNQALLPYRSKYPIAAAPMLLSKNCRNAGRVYELVRRFHPQSPEPSMWLSGEGSAKRWDFNAGDETEVITHAVTELVVMQQMQNVVVLTTEPEPIEQSLLYGLEILLQPKKRWQDFLMKYLSGYGSPNFALSDSPLPTKQDVANVQTFAQKFYPKTWKPPRDLRKEWAWKWKENEHNYTITGEYRLAKLTFDDWTDDMPVAHRSAVILGKNREDATSITLPLYTVSAYKGLEADGVVLFIPARRPDLDSIVYVGASRAKLVLHIVAEKRAIESVRHLLGASAE